MTIEILANVTASNYAQIREICRGGLPEEFETWQYEQQRASHGLIDKSSQPSIVVEVDLGELRAYVRRTGWAGDTAIHNYAVEKAARMQQT